MEFYEEIGELFGSLITIFFLLASVSYLLTWIFKNYRHLLKINADINKLYMRVLQFIKKYHQWFGYATILFIFIHAFIQIQNSEISVTGIIAAILMGIEVLLGYLGQYIISKPRPKWWILIHRIIPIAIIVMILIHTN